MLAATSALAALAILTSSCRFGQPPTAVVSATATGCPLTDSALQQLVAAPDPAAFAATAGLKYEGGRVRVEIRTADGDDNLASKYDLRVSARYQSLLEATVPVSRLCALASDNAVLQISRVHRTTTD